MLCALHPLRARQWTAQDSLFVVSLAPKHAFPIALCQPHHLLICIAGGEFRLTRHASIQRDHEAPFQDIPSHGRYQHFCIGGRDRIAELLGSWPDSVDNTERCRRLVDLFFISVLLDAGAGTTWTYKSVENGKRYRRSEGIAVASLEMFKSVGCNPNPSFEGPLART